MHIYKVSLLGIMMGDINRTLTQIFLSHNFMINFMTLKINFCFKKYTHQKIIANFPLIFHRHIT